MDDRAEIAASPDPSAEIAPDAHLSRGLRDRPPRHGAVRL